jgi:hypothetical protein
MSVWQGRAVFDLLSGRWSSSHFPRLELVDLRPLRDAIRAQEDDAWNQQAFVQEEDERRACNLHELRESLDTAHRCDNQHDELGGEHQGRVCRAKRRVEAWQE